MEKETSFGCAPDERKKNGHRNDIGAAKFPSICYTTYTRYTQSSQVSSGCHRAAQEGQVRIWRPATRAPE